MKKIVIIDHGKDFKDMPWEEIAEADIVIALTVIKHKGFDEDLVANIKTFLQN